MNLKLTSYGTIKANAIPFQGRYPCGTLVYNGVWYYGSYALNQAIPNIKKSYGWYVMGPFMGFHWSKDFGVTWNKSPCTLEKPLFAEPSYEKLDLDLGKEGPYVKMGAPHFVDFGRNMQYSPDEKAYLVGHGAEFPDSKKRIANNSWVTGDAIYLVRVTPSIENINDVSKYEFFGGNDSNGRPMWVKDFSKIKPIFEWNNNCGIVTITYNAPLKKYFMCITNGHRGDTTRKNYTSYIMVSESLTSGWKMLSYVKNLGLQAYFLNIPSKFISKNGKTMWLCYSANYMDAKNYGNKNDAIAKIPSGSAMSMSLHKFKLLDK